MLTLFQLVFSRVAVAPFVLVGTNGQKNERMKKLTTLALVALFCASGAYAQQIKSVVLEKRHDQKVLRFMVPSEANVADYRIEGSYNNDHFEFVGKVKSSGNSVLAKTYQYSLLGDFMFYRVAAVGMSGKVSYSETVASLAGDAYQSRATMPENEGVVRSR